MEYTATKWLNKRGLNSNIVTFFRGLNELAVVDNLLLRQKRMVIPASLMTTMIGLAHETHPGIIRTKQRLRER